jgi:hypothetical protein
MYIFIYINLQKFLPVGCSGIQKLCDGPQEMLGKPRAAARLQAADPWPQPS